MSLLALTAGGALGQPASDKPRYQRLDSTLNELAVAATAGPGEAGIAAAARTTLGELGLLEFGEGRVGITIRFRGPSGDVEALVLAAGGHVAHVFDGAMEAYVDPRFLPEFEALPNVGRVEAIRRSVPQVISQGVSTHNATTWQAAGYLGQGVKVGIVDSGYLGWSSLPPADRPYVAAARCWVGGGYYSSNFVDCQSESVHGTAVAEAVHDLAPSASLYLAKTSTKGEFAAAVQWLVSQGVRVINASVSFPWDGPGNGTSPEPDSPLNAVDAAVSAGALVTISSGNYGESSWFGSWYDPDADGFLSFASGLESACAVVSAGDTMTVQLRWQDAWGGATRDLDLELWHYVSNTTMARSNSLQSGGWAHVPFELASFVAPLSGTYCASVRRYSGTAPGWVQLQTRQNSLTFDVATQVGSVSNPAETANPGALAVGAANWQTPLTIEPFSGSGPTPDGRIKPDIVGVDKADSVSYGPNGFSGTSQSAPHVAGLAALLFEGYWNETPAQMASRLKNWALPRGGAVPNNTWGYGLAYLPSIYKLAVTKLGSGLGYVSSDDGLIDCGAYCQQTYFSGGQITLTAVPAPGSIFQGWSGGGCTGTATCVVSTSAAATVSATFGTAPPLPAFTDDPLSARFTPVKAIHITELRQRINELRTRYSLQSYAWSDATITPGVTAVRAAHLTELRAALSAVYTAASFRQPTYTTEPVLPFATVITATQIAEVRAAVALMWSGPNLP